MCIIFRIFLLTNCVDWGIIEIPAAANVDGRPIIAHSSGNVKKNFFVKIHKKKSAPSTTGSGQHDLELSSVKGEAELSLGVRDLVSVAHRQDCGKKCV